MTGLEERLAPLTFDRWRFSIQTSMNIDQLMLVVAAYLSTWSSTDRLMLPPDLVPPIATPEDLLVRAVEASREDVKFQGNAARYPYLREFSLTITFAASRLRYLQAIQSSQHGT